MLRREQSRFPGKRKETMLNRNMRKWHKGMTNKRRDLLERWHGDREGSKKEAVQLQGISQRG